MWRKVLRSPLQVLKLEGPKGPEILGKNNSSLLVIDRYGNFHLTDTDMHIITYTVTNQKKTNSSILIRYEKIVRYRYRYEKLLDTDTDTIIL